MKKAHIIRLVAFLIIFIIAALLIHNQFDTIKDIPALVQSFGIWSGVIFIILYALGPVFFVPASILTLAAGTLFGTFWGLIYVLIGANIASNLVFILARYFGKGVQEGIATSKHLKKWDTRIQENGFLTVLYLRLIPIFPYVGLNWAFPLTKVTHRDYALGTFFGMIPASFAFVYLGENITQPGSSEFWLALLVFVLVATIPLLVKKYVDAKNKTKKHKQE